MKKSCTDLFLRYREIARLVWNLGFWPNPELRVWDSERIYDEAITRLFEAMVLRPLEFSATIELSFDPGNAVRFTVTPNHPGANLMVDAHRPEKPGRLWGSPTVVLGAQKYEFRFVSFFDWDQLGIRDFALLEVLIERFDETPDLVGRHALLELAGCSIWVNQPDSSGSALVSRP